MIQTYLTFSSAILLSGMAAYYSILGLALIFSGAFWPVVFMGSSLEFAKLVSASWLYRNWETSPRLLKYYLTSAVTILMLLTSMGIFGFLAKSHIDSTIDAGNNSSELRVLNQQEKVAKERLDYLLKRAGDPEKANAGIDKQIQQTQKELSDINKKRLPLLKEENRLVADVGPVKYVADMFFDGDNALDKAVRLVIFTIMLVFDPLAVLLLIAGNISLERNKNEQKNTKENNLNEVDDMYVVDKDNLTMIKSEEDEKTHDIVIEQIAPGVYTEDHIPIRSTQVYKEEHGFKQKTNK